MPIYDLRCSQCGTTQEVILLGGEAAPTVCRACGGELRRLLSRFAVVSRGGEAPAAATPVRSKSCGHTSACRCAVKLDRPNPFADRLEPVGGSG
jgi:putative FmdB family regulatory protein